MPVWGGYRLAPVIDCHIRQLPGWHLPRTGKASTASAGLEQALITCYGALGRNRLFIALQGLSGLPHTLRLLRRGR